MSDRGLQSTIAQVRDWVVAARSVVALTGAGISTDSGIPDFRGPNGLWVKNPEAEKASDIRYYLADPQIRRAAWQNRLHHPAWTAEPNAAHRALVELESSGRLHTLITQNIDGLHQRAGASPERIVEIHGTVTRVVCLSCGDRRPMEHALARVRAGEDDPPCLLCGGILKSDTISFGQPLVVSDLQRAEAAAQVADLLLAVGTSLTVYPVAAIPGIARGAGAMVVIVNGEPTSFDDRADAVLRGPIGEILPALLSGLPPA